MKFSPTPEQKHIINLFDGKHIVLAPPGSGKTQILADRIRQAVQNGYDPAKMICLTFTNRASRNMMDRMGEDDKYSNIFVGNLHSYAAHFLKKNKIIPVSAAILDETDTKEFVEEAKLKFDNNVELIIEEYEHLLEKSSYPSSGELNNIASKISTKLTVTKFIHENSQQTAYQFLSLICKRKPLKIEKFLKCNSSIYKIENGFEKNLVEVNVDTFKPEEKLIIYNIRNEYEKLKKLSRVYDFDDILNLTYFHLKKNDTIRLKNQFNWVQVDEAQDLNLLQWEILELITAYDGHTVLFGDLEQSIYAFQGARPDFLKQKKASSHNLSQNFRSPKYLLDLYNHYAIKNLHPDWKKPPYSSNNTVTKESPKLYTIKGDQNSECDFIVKQIEYASKLNNETIALLLRTNRQADQYSASLREIGIKHFKVAHNDIFKRKAVKDVFSYLSILQNQEERLSWQRIFHLFGKTATLREARTIINAMYEIGFRPMDFLNDFKNVDLLEKFAKAVKEKKTIIFDTETTGKSVLDDDIIQLAYVIKEKGNFVKSQVYYISTEIPISEKALEVHGISKDLLKEKGRSRELIYRKFFNEVNSKSVLIAHNLFNFDLPILKNNLIRYGLYNPIIEGPALFDSLAIARRVFPDAKNHKLEYLFKEYLNLGDYNAHDALSDVEATFKIIDKMSFKIENLVDERVKFIEGYKKYLFNFSDNFSELWNHSNNDLEKETSFRNLFEEFFNYSYIKIRYAAHKESEADLEKIIAHTERHVGARKASILIKEFFPKYRLYKEPDIIDEQYDKLVVSTIHKAKGLEFDNVYIVQCDNDSFPFYKSKTEDEILEDARLLYVAMTRAKRKLNISHTTSFKGHPKEMSRFLTDLIEHFTYSKN